MRTISLSILVLAVAGCGAGVDLDEDTPAALVPRVAFGARQLKTHADEGSRIPLVGDLNGDGCQDVVYVGPDSASSYLSTCSGGFRARQLTSFASQGGRARRLNDIDGDGRDDLLFVGASDIRVLLSDGSGGFALRPLASHPRETGEVFTLDADHDGRADVFYRDETAARSVCYRSLGDGRFALAPALSATLGAPRESYLRRRILDVIYCPPTGGLLSICGLVEQLFAGDSYTEYLHDLFAASFSGGPLQAAYLNPTTIHAGRADGSYQEQTHPDEGWRVPFVGDVDGDGLDDASYVGRNDVAIYLSSGEAFLPRTQVAHPDEGAAVPRFGDLDGDGRLDLLYLGATTISTYLFTGR